MDHRTHSRQVTGARCTKVAARQSWAEYSSRPTTGAEQWSVRWPQCLISKWSCVNFQFQLHTQIACKPTYVTHDLCYMLLFIIGTDIKFNHTNLAIHSSGHSRCLFTSTSDYASGQWRLMLHILVTCSPHFRKYWVTRAIYGIRWGWSHWPITIQHVRAQWGSVVSQQACLTGSEKAEPVSRSIGFIFANFDHWLKHMIYWCVISSRWRRIMLLQKCYAFCLKWMHAVRCWPWVYSLGLVSRYSTVRSGTVTWHEWGLWYGLYGPRCLLSQKGC